MSITSRSIHSLPPLEIGGTVARRGFAVQDHVAAGHCLNMLEDPTLGQVWCETQDDVTLLWGNGAGEEVEFVQVKAHEFDQLWSIAKLLEKEKVEKSDDEPDDTAPPNPISTNGDGTGADATADKYNGSPKGRKRQDSRCILEKSLQYDRCDERVRFRIVTARPVKDELTFLTHPIGSANRDKTKGDYITLLTKVREKLGDFKSENGNDCTFWIDRTLWEWVHSLDSVKQKNLLKTLKLVERSGQYLAIDQVEELYQRLLTKVYDGGLARWDTEVGKKKILRADLIAWFEAAVNDAAHPGHLGTGKKLDSKLRDAGIDPDQFEAIAEMRHRYRLERLTPKYARETQAEIEGEIRARLMTLRSNLDGKLLEVDGIAFHAMCINQINEVCAFHKENERPPAENLYGYMYDLADRCTHRFVRAKT